MKNNRQFTFIACEAGIGDDIAFWQHCCDSKCVFHERDAASRGKHG